MGKTNILWRLTHNKIPYLDGFRLIFLPLTKLDTDSDVKLNDSYNEGSGIAVSYRKFVLLHMNLFYGAFSLKNAWDEKQIGIHGKMSEHPMFYRTMHLQNAYTTYNSCVDYIYQILYFYYDLEGCVGKAMSNEELIKCEARVVANMRGKYIKCLKKHNTKLSEAMKKFHAEIKGLNDKANIIKHRANFWVNGNHIPKFGQANKTIKGERINLTTIIEPKPKEISEEIEFLISVNEAFAKIERKLFDELRYIELVDQFLKSRNLNR